MLPYFPLADYLDYFTEEIAVIAVKNLLQTISLKFTYSSPGSSPSFPSKFLSSAWDLFYFFYTSELAYSSHPLSSSFLPQSWCLLSFTCAHTPSLLPLASSCSDNDVLSYSLFQSISSHNFLLSLKHGKIFLIWSAFSSALLLPQSVISQCTLLLNHSYFIFTS